ncbi:hypothetical protein CLPU_6c01040 [Gottschalkia purinilytica]|uniref:Arginase n=1 Tax=Gottschalkia purinilytica TaxID=1503 RepID=A0A0L0WAU9_GOTPU|nr:hypothetical protein CLPU_6c01040 [Gottschalkia purinilytica]
MSIDWDYFIPMKNEWNGSYLENQNNINDQWYRRYLECKFHGEDIEKIVDVSNEVNDFWSKIRKKFRINKDVKVYVSESHKLSYKLAIDHSCQCVYSFDAHSDLGYGSCDSIYFQTNCSNWLGKLLKNNLIEKAHIIYSPYSFEKQEDFEEISKKYSLDFANLESIKENENEEITVIHICRSGAWTPPWLDKKFYNFIKELNIPYEVIDCPMRKWDIKNLNLSDQINYMLCS